jgi:hypothetical protein
VGNDLLGACLLCAGLLLGMDLAPHSGWNAELGAAYATIGRRYQLMPGREDVSDTTGKFVMIGVGQNQPAPDGLGGGTPRFEWRFRIAVAPAHDEQKQGAFAPGQTTASGTGRFENFALLTRLPLGQRDSIELSGARKNFDATDLVNEGGQKFTFNEERTLATDRIDVALGWRHRWSRLEASAAVIYVKADGSDGTSGAFHHSGGGVFGAAIDARTRQKNWVFLVAAQRASGSMPVGERSAPDFSERTYSTPALLENYRVGIGLSGDRTDALFSTSYDHSALPFVAFAVLGTEQVDFEQGFHPTSTARQLILDFKVRSSVTPFVRPSVFLRWSRGNEKVRLIDASGSQRAVRLDVTREAGFFGHKESPFGDISIGLGVDISSPLGH